MEQDIKQEIATVARDITFPAFAGVLRETDDTLITRGQGKGLKLYDEIERDCHAYAVLMKRKMAVIAREWQIDPASTSRIDKKAADLVRAQIAAMDFDHVCLNLLDALLKGFAVGEIMWAEDGAELVATEVRPRDQRRFGFGDDYQIRLKTPDNFLPGEAVPDKKLIVHSFGAKDGNPYGLGMGSRLFWPVFFKRKGITFWLTFLDKFGNPTAVGKYPPGASLPDQKKLLDALGALSQDAGITIPDGMLIDLLEASRSGTAGYEQLCRYMDEEVTIAVLGEAASVKGGGGQAIQMGSIWLPVGQRRHHPQRSAAGTGEGRCRPALRHPQQDPGQMDHGTESAGRHPAAPVAQGRGAAGFGRAGHARQDHRRHGVPAQAGIHPGNLWWRMGG